MKKLMLICTDKKFTDFFKRALNELSDEKLVIIFELCNKEFFCRVFHDVVQDAGIDQ